MFGEWALRIGIMERAFCFDPGSKTGWRTSSLKSSGSHPSIRRGVLVEKGTGYRAPADPAKVVGGGVVAEYSSWPL